MLVCEGINSFPKDVEFKDSPLFYCSRYGHKDAIEVIVKRFPKILQEKTKGGIGKCPNNEYIDAWAELSGIIKKEDGLPTGRDSLTFFLFHWIAWGTAIAAINLDEDKKYKELQLIC